MSGDVSVGVMLTVERVFDGGDMTKVAHPSSAQQVQKRLPSVSTYAARGGSARRTPQFLQTVPLRAFSSAVERARSGFAHTPLRAQTHFGAAPARAGVKGAPGRRDRGAQGCSQQSQKTTLSFQKQPVTNARRAPSGYKNRPKREASPERDATLTRAGILSAK